MNLKMNIFEKEYNLENITFDYSNVYWNTDYRFKDVPRTIAKCENGFAELPDGTKYPVIGKPHNGNFIKGLVIDFYPDYSCVQSATFKGKPLRDCPGFVNKKLKLDLRTSNYGNYDENGQYKLPVNVFFFLEGIKREYNTIYDPSKYVIKAFTIEKYLSIPLTFTFKPFKEIGYSAYGAKHIGFSDGGGGYGEKYWVSTVHIYREEELIKELLGNKYLHPDFIEFIMYGKAPEGISEMEWYFEKESNLLNFFRRTDIWDIEVEYERYEGYLPRYYRMYSSYVKEFNELIESRIKEYQGPTIVDWRTIAV